MTGLLRRATPHWGLGLVLLAGIALRLVAVAAYWPGLWFPDTQRYLYYGVNPKPDPIRPVGYSVLLYAFRKAGFEVGAVTAAQHLMALALVVAVYAFLYRRGVPRWAAVLAVAPVALDGFELLSERYVLSETLFLTLLTAGVLLLLWKRRPGPLLLAGAGLVLGAAMLVRTVGVVVIALAGLYLLLRWPGWLRVAAYAAGALLVVGGYTVWFHSTNHAWALSTYQGRFLYGRVAPFADCDKTPVTGELRKLCENGHIYADSNSYVWGKNSPARQFDGDPRASAKLQRFAVAVITHQPLDYASVVTRESALFFAPWRDHAHAVVLVDGRKVNCADWVYFPSDPVVSPSPRRSPSCAPLLLSYGLKLRPVGYHADRGADRFLHDYQRFGYTPGPFLALCAVAVVIAAFRRRVPWRDRLDALFLGAAGVGLIVFAIATSLFDYRYGLPALVLLPAAGAMAYTQLRVRSPQYPASEEAQRDRPAGSDRPAPVPERGGDAGGLRAEGPSLTG
jgi:4-amino-4-deoxy-L-arabinose transferase-like glycosyltransferase